MFFCLYILEKYTVLSFCLVKQLFCWTVYSNKAMMICVDIFCVHSLPPKAKISLEKKGSLSMERRENRAIEPHFYGRKTLIRTTPIFSSLTDFRWLSFALQVYLFLVFFYLICIFSLFYRLYSSRLCSLSRPCCLLTYLTKNKHLRQDPPPLI